MSDKSKELYRLANSEQAKRIGEFAELENPTTRTHEIAVCRNLIEESLKNGNVSVANSLLNTLNSLQKNEFKRQLIEHELITRPSIKRFCEVMIRIFSEEIAVLPNWEDVLLRVSDRVDEALCELKNDTKDLEGVKIPR